MIKVSKIFLFFVLLSFVFLVSLAAQDEKPVIDSNTVDLEQNGAIERTSQHTGIEESINESTQSIINLQENFIYFTILLLVLISIVAILINKGLRSNKKLVAELLQSNKAISEKNQHLESLVAVKNKIFSIISHDLKTPIISLNNSLEVMKNETVKKELKNKALESSKQQLDNTINLLNNLLDWAKNQMEAIKPKMEAVNIYETISQNLKLIDHAAAQKKINIVVECEKKMIVVADIELINLVLRNLLSNAVKFTPKNGGITISASSNNGSVKISVQDSGIGISAEDQEKILSPDKFIKKYGTNFETGSGIGLKLCLDYIKYMNGMLSIESEPDKGSTFSFTLPSNN